MRLAALRAGGIAAAVLATGGVAAANTSHAGWPQFDGQRIMHSSDQDGEIRPQDPQRHNELLGGHGNDTIDAGDVGDVLWGDYKPSGQPTTQFDHLYGGPGKDFIYTSHGHNVIVTGGGADEVHAHYGYGSITCTSKKATVFLSHKSRKKYKLHGCTKISYKTVGH